MTCGEELANVLLRKANNPHSAFEGSREVLLQNRRPNLPDWIRTILSEKFGIRDPRTGVIKKKPRATIRVCSGFLALLAGISALCAENSIPVMVHQNFSSDPGWDNCQNRVVGTGMPRRMQDFGWSLSSHAASADTPGEIGGHVANSRIQAYYAMPLGRPLTFNDRISVSGQFALTELGKRGVSCFGLFNSSRHTWRVFSSMAFRLWEEENYAQVMFDWMSADWRGRGQETAVLIAPDGARHTFQFDYDPDVRPDCTRLDPLLAKHLTSETGNGRPIELQGESFILQRAHSDEPELTAEGLHRRLVAAREEGLAEYFHRHGQHRWWKTPHPEKNHGRLRFQLDQEEPYIMWFDEEIRSSLAEFDRFGLFNICRYGTGQTVYFSNLTLNGQPIDFSQDPHWMGHNNRCSLVEPDFHSMNNFGWSQTNWAGDAPGEMGGLIWRLEPDDPGFAYYADDAGALTIEDPIEFSGRICFVDGMTDASMFFGYFNHEEFMHLHEEGGKSAGFPHPSMMGITLNDATAIGYYFAPMLCSADRTVVGDSGRFRFLPDRKPCSFSFRYDPHANHGAGRVSYEIDGNTGSFDLTSEQRNAGACFDRFGLATVRQGGNSVEIYFDDLNYLVRRDTEAHRTFHPQVLIERPYPVESAGRLH